MSDTVVSALKITRSSARTHEDPTDIYDMEVVELHLSIDLPVLLARYPVTKVLKRPAKKLAVSESPSVDQYPRKKKNTDRKRKKKNTDLQIQKDEKVLEVIVSASTTYLSQNALVAKNCWILQWIPSVTFTPIDSWSCQQNTVCWQVSNFDNSVNLLLKGPPYRMRYEIEKTLKMTCSHMQK